MTVLEYLQRKGFSYQVIDRPSGRNAQMNCPFCGDTEKKFAINIETGAFNCLHVNRCGKSGSWYEFQRLMGDMPLSLDGDKNIYHRAKNKQYERPNPDRKMPNARMIEYFGGRKITPETVRLFKIAENKDGAIMFPYFKAGELVNIKYRTYDKKMWSEKNAEPVLYNRDMIEGDELVICEGEIDAMSLYEYGIIAASVPSGVNDLRWIENEWEWLDRFSRVYICMDTDRAGQEAVKTIVARLGLWRCYNVVLPRKDANDCLKDGVPAEEIKLCIDNAKGYDIDTVAHPSDFEDEIIYLFNNPEADMGIKTCFTGLNKTLKGWREGELTIWSGSSGSGKTTFLNQVMIGLMFGPGERVCIGSFEFLPKHLLKWLLMQASEGRPMHNGSIKKFLKQLDEFLYLVDVNSEIKPEVLLDTFEFVARKYGVKHFVVDSLMRIALPGIRELAEQKEFVNKLIDFAKHYRVCVHLVAHPRKGQKDNDTPGKVDVSGSSDITNLAHNVLIMYRIDDDDKPLFEEKKGFVADAILYVKKNRYDGEQGRVYLRFQKNTKTYYEVDAEHPEGGV